MVFLQLLNGHMAYPFQSIEKNGNPTGQKTKLLLLTRSLTNPSITYSTCSLSLLERVCMWDTLWVILQVISLRGISATKDTMYYIHKAMTLLDFLQSNTPFKRVNTPL